MSRPPQLCHTTGSGTNPATEVVLDEVEGGRLLVVVVVVVVVVVDVAASPTNDVHAVANSAASATSAVMRRPCTGRW